MNISSAPPYFSGGLPVLFSNLSLFTIYLPVFSFISSSKHYLLACLKIDFTVNDNFAHINWMFDFFLVFKREYGRGKILTLTPLLQSILLCHSFSSFNRFHHALKILPCLWCKNKYLSTHFSFTPSWNATTDWPIREAIHLLNQVCPSLFHSISKHLPCLRYKSSYLTQNQSWLCCLSYTFWDCSWISETLPLPIWTETYHIIQTKSMLFFNIKQTRSKPFLNFTKRLTGC